MMTIKTQLSSFELETRYETAADPVAKSHFHGLKSVHDQRGWDALVAIGYSIQQPRPRHPAAATEEDRAALKKNFRPRPPRSVAAIPARRSRSGRWTNTASV